MRNSKYCLGLVLLLLVYACGKGSKVTPTPVEPSSFSFSALKVNGVYNGFSYNNVTTQPVIKISFSAAINHNSIANSIAFNSKAGAAVNFTTTYENHDSTLVISPAALQAITQYTLAVSTNLKSAQNGSLQNVLNVQLTTAVDTTNKF
ncbi:MAG: Ig-like domain-containing protein, partial [Mucilaginibacter sp.]